MPTNSRFCQETPGFNGNLLVSWFLFFISRFLSQNNILLLFQNNQANHFSPLFITYHEKWGDFGNLLSFYLFSSHPYLYCHAAFGKKHLALCAQLSRSRVLLCTHDTKRKEKLLEYSCFKYQAVLKIILCTGCY